MQQQQQQRDAQPVTGNRRGGFTLVEMLLSVSILAVAVALIISAYTGSVRYVRDRVTELQLRSLDVAVQQFEADYGFLPPLVDASVGDPRGGGPLVDYDKIIEEGSPDLRLGCITRNVLRPVRDSAPTGRLKVFGYADFDAGDEDSINKYLRNETFNNNDRLYPRYSFVSLGAYLLGGLPAEVDGGSGNLMGRPTPDGRFDESKEKRAPVLDVGTMTENRRARRREVEGAGLGIDARSLSVNIIVDRNLLSVRYYRWEPLYHGSTAATVQGRAGSPANDPTRIGSVRDENVPYLLGYQAKMDWQSGGSAMTAADMPLIRQTSSYRYLATQRYALAAGGPDGQFGGINEVTDRKLADDNLIISAGRLVAPEGSR